MGIVSVNLNITNFNKDDSETIIHVRLGVININNVKHLKKILAKT